METRHGIPGGVRASAWLGYAIIVFEILYMISPFALYYYSAYQVPLLFLQDHGATAWLTQYFLPHFTGTGGVLDALLAVSWPLMALGLLVFLVSFAQIYGAKLFKRGPVTGGLYAHIRHPQYLALAILGLGATLYWSRFLVLAMYATMLFLYWFLARQEERLCAARYGDGYRQYQARTGMFLPAFLARRLPGPPFHLPAGGWRRGAAVAGIYLVFMAGVLGLGAACRALTFTQLPMEADARRVLLAVVPVERDVLRRTAALAEGDPRVRGVLASQVQGPSLWYLVPTGWAIPELALDPQVDCATGDYIGRAAAHGNAGRPVDGRWTIVICRPLPADPAAHGADILRRCLRTEPLAAVRLDMATGQVNKIEHPLAKGPWAGIPVPVF